MSFFEQCIWSTRYFSIRARQWLVCLCLLICPAMAACAQEAQEAQETQGARGLRGLQEPQGALGVRGPQEPQGALRVRGPQESQGARAACGPQAGGVGAGAGAPAFRVLAFYSTTVEADHVDFARDAIRFYGELSQREHFIFDTTTDWRRMNGADLKLYQLVVWLNDFPQRPEQRAAFEKYMEGGGAWLGFHVSAYNDRDTHWPWMVRFLGGAVFYNNNWPPLPACLNVEDTLQPATLGLPAHYKAPINEWYGWKPDPRNDPRVRVLVSLDTANYPLGKKDIIRSGDIPVVWTNTRYHMLYMNMGHGDQIFSSAVQNRLFANAILWLGL